ncbi:small integral membrane protein 24-like [Panthera pardus]|uniref:Small integral membrane protein 24-like n=1 Tax=Panthera pardus TaxID=9691 RepID=A0A9V1EQR9_PANPR|nr:small integral membrane protein 24-like [Panthera pardus]XP_042783319.1 small integral membrane protein 24-like [Panthera leo]XP_042833190.1 small integral membrane protein 24-like [Panthera tigris]XP_049495559.1 small integral membrane protein 24-like [Panthera uncia]
MDRFWMTAGRVSLLEALVPCLVQAQPLAQRKPWLVGLGAALAALFLTFVLTVVYAVWCRESRDSNKEEDVGSVRKEEKEAEGDQGLELEEREVPPNREGVVSSSK